MYKLDDLLFCRNICDIIILYYKLRGGELCEYAESA